MTRLNYKQEYYKKNKQYVLDKVHEYYDINKDKILEQKKKYYQDNVINIKEKMKEYRQDKGKELYQNRIEYCKNYRLVNKSKASEYSRNRNQLAKIKTLSHYSICKTSIICSVPGCLVTDLDMLCIDHINDNGKEHREKVGAGSAIYSWLIKNCFPSGFQVLCANHNLKKQIQKCRSKSETQ